MLAAVVEQALTVAEEEDGLRADQWLVRRFDGLGRGAARRFLEAGLMRVDGARPRKGTRLRAGARVVLAQRPGLVSAEADARTDLIIVHEDRWLVVADKPAGVPSHPLRPGELGTLAGALLSRYPEMAEVGYSAREPGILHRLDTDTSGLVLAARDLATFDALRDQLEGGAIDKRYVALCDGTLEAPQVLEAWLSGRGRRVTARTEPFPSGRPVRLELLDAVPVGTCSLVTVRVAAAARHQIRAQLALVGHAIVGDALYGGSVVPGLDRHFLHASGLAFCHPATGEPMAPSSALPSELELILRTHT